MATAAAAAASEGLRVCVVGAGVAGLTTALRLLHEPNVSVTVVADASGADTTSAGAAGLWGPYKLSDTPEADVTRWGAETYEHLMGLAHSQDARAAGISLCTAHSLYPDRQQLPFWSGLTHSCTELDARFLDALRRQHLPLQRQQQQQQQQTEQQQLGAAQRGGPSTAAARTTAASTSSAASATSGSAAPPTCPFTFSWGYQFLSVVCEGQFYLPWLEAQIRQRGGRLVTHHRLRSLPEAAALQPEQLHEGAAGARAAVEHSGGGAAGSSGAGGATAAAGGAAAGGGGFDVLVNCAGLRSKELLDDPEVYPIRGQIMRVRAPWVTQAYFYGDFYIIPNPCDGTVVLGGTGQVGRSDTSVCPDDKARIWEGCCALLPSLRGAQWVRDWVGLRPGRTRLRLEVGQQAVAVGGPGGREVRLVHNYGHGGAGLTLAWGCAGDVVRGMRERGWLR